MTINSNYTLPRPQTDLANGFGRSASDASTMQSGLQYVQTAYNVFEILDSKATEEEKIQGIRDTVGLAVADAYTGGLASQAYGLMERYFPGVMESIREFDAKYNIGLKLLSSLFDTDRWKTEGNRLRDLIEKGVQIPESLQGPMQLTRGRSKEELIDPSVPPDFRGFTEDGRWVNNAFAVSRDESLLAPEDIWGYATFFEKFGNDWLGTFSEEKRRAIAQRALDLGLVREHHGTIDVTWSPELEEFARTA
ncbi:MAG: hypothetical protein QY326_04855 [Bdellovibrionota bacterium]|nr:MAG: hypothetical protein QY326_04855 [Bdellovibrionota bacterium]